MDRNERIRIFVEEIAPHLPVHCVQARVKLDMAGFFDAPASTKYHGACEGGLFEHSLCVMRQLVLLTERNGLRWQREDSPWLVGFFHDLCKVDQYTLIEDAGKSRYAFNSNTLLRGHGDKSVMMLCELTALTGEEVACIRYHMGAFTEQELWNDYTRAIHTWPNVLWTHTADMIATHICDR